jgi:D-galactose 1-dehydrogenase
MQTTKIAIVGYGKIAQDQHAPSIAETEGMELVATVSRKGLSPAGIPAFASLDALVNSGVAIDAVALCMPPEGRNQIAMAAADNGWDILLEKPPAASAAEVLQLAEYVRGAGQIMFTTWHSQYNPAVDAAALRLAGQDVVAMHIEWREDVRKWHPGQDWIWQAGGFGVFDPGINALSIATKIMPTPLNVQSARLTIAENHQTPIAVNIDFGPQLSAHFDWRETGDECWRISIQTANETMLLDKGGSELWVDGVQIVTAPSREYRLIYRHFGDLLRTRQSHVDIAPLILVEEAERIGVRNHIAAFMG